jgi:hypothetical protein
VYVYVCVRVCVCVCVLGIEDIPLECCIFQKILKPATF